VRARVYKTDADTVIENIVIEGKDIIYDNGLFNIFVQLHPDTIDISGVVQLQAYLNQGTWYLWEVEAHAHAIAGALTYKIPAGGFAWADFYGPYDYIKIDSVVITDLNPLTPVLKVDPEELDFGNIPRSASYGRKLYLTNIGGESLSWSANSNKSWIDLSSTSGNLQHGETDIIDITVNTDNLNYGEHNGTIDINSNGGDKDVPVTLQVVEGEEEIIEIQPETEGEDTYVDYCTYTGGPNSAPYGGDNLFYAGVYCEDSPQHPDYKGKNRAYIEFDLSQIPSGLTISSAYLKLYGHSGGYGTNPTATLAAYKVNGYWSESNLIWNTQPSFDNSPIDIITVQKDIGWYSWDITSLFTKWYNEQTPNRGAIIKDPDEDSHYDEDNFEGYAIFATSDFKPGQGNWQRPILAVTYLGTIGPVRYYGQNIKSDDDDNGEVNQEETIGLKIQLKNEGNVTARNVSADISSNDLYVLEITDDSEDYGDIDPGDEVWCEYDYDFKVKASTPHNHRIVFELTITASGNYQWHDSFEITVMDNDGPSAPSISSSSHPAQNAWFSDNDPSFTWSTPSDPSGIVEYCYKLNQIADYVPNPDTDSKTPYIGESYTDLADGTWWFHVRAKDGANNWGETNHYKINIDVTKPGIVSNLASASHTLGQCSDDNTIEVSWTPATDNMSGIAGYSIIWDHSSGTIPDRVADIGPVTCDTSPPLADGDDWYFHIRSVDYASNCSDYTVHLGPFCVGAGLWSETPNFGTGITWDVVPGDCDNDGDVDIAVGNVGVWDSVNWETLPAQNYLYLNNGDGTFTEIPTFGTGVTFCLDWGDYDNDGDLDLAVGNNGQNYLYRNEGNGNFIGLELFGSGETCGLDWGDYDNDGDMDLILANWIIGDATLYRNDGNSLFTQIETFGEATHVAWQDFDSDDNLDFALGRGHCCAPLTFYKNNGDGIFSVVAEFSPDDENASLDWGDFDNDGDADLLVGNTESEHNRLYENIGNCTFVEHNVCEMEYPAPLTFSMKWGDYDNDGDLDIVWAGLGFLSFINDITFLTVPGIVYRNDEDFYFTPTTYFGHSVDSLPVEIAVSAWCDYDNDYDLDIAVGSFELVSEFEIIEASNFMYVNNVKPGNPNDTPSPPTELNCDINDQCAILSWNDGYDPETPTNGLTYNLRVGITSGGNEILSGAIPVGPGNVGYALSRTVTSLPACTCYWSVQTVDGGFARSSWADEQEFTLVGVKEATQENFPKTFYLSESFPNPFISITSFTYGIPRASHVIIKVYDSTGRQIQTILDYPSICPGYHTVHWNGRDNKDQRVASGVYFCQMEAEGFKDLRKMILLR
jgi:hypothetical protein